MGSRLAVVVVGLALVLGGCTVGGGAATGTPGEETMPSRAGAATDIPDSPTPPSGLVGDVPQTPPQASWFTVIDPPPPLAQYARAADGPMPTADEQSAHVEWLQQLVDLIAQCMADQGFPYVPADMSLPVEEVWPGDLETFFVPVLSQDRATVERYGYGVMAAADAELAADPNAEYQSTLSAAEAAAYAGALFGDLPDSGTVYGEGCSRKSMAQLPPQSQPAQDRRDAFFAEFGDLLAGAQYVARNGLATDQRVVELNQEWESCMNARGFVFEEVSKSAAPLSAMAPMEAIGVATRTRPDGTLGPVPINKSGNEIPVEEKSLLGTPAERPVALADFDCRAETDYLERLTAVRVELDNEFMAAHRAELDRLMAAAELW